MINYKKQWKKKKKAEIKRLTVLLLQAILEAQSYSVKGLRSWSDMLTMFPMFVVKQIEVYTIYNHIQLVIQSSFKPKGKVIKVIAQYQDAD